MKTLENSEQNSEQFESKKQVNEGKCIQISVDTYISKLVRYIKLDKYRQR